MAAWGCHVHNEVNKSLNKEIFDCSNIGDFYDCGCAEDEDDATSGSQKETRERPEMSPERKSKVTASDGMESKADIVTGDAPLKLEKEG